MNSRNEATLDDVLRRLDTLNVLMARSLYGGRRANEAAPLLHDLGLSTRQISLVLETSVKNVQNRLAEARKTNRSQEEES